MKKGREEGKTENKRKRERTEETAPKINS